MVTVEQRIAQLKRELSLLEEERARTQSAADSSPSGVFEKADSGCFSIISEEELALVDLSPLAKCILDALPVQVFIKHAVPGAHGRRYAYLNQTARSIVAWSAKEVPLKYDSDAFAGGVTSSEWQAVLKGEGETLQARTPQRRQRNWTVQTEFGEEWRRNIVDEIPIMSPGNDGPVGLCAIAQDIGFQTFMGTHSQLRKVFRHEYSNLAASILKYTERVRRALESADPGASPKDLRGIAGNLLIAKKYLLMSARVADALYVAVRNLDPRELGTAEAVLRNLEDIHKDAPFQLVVDPDNVVRLTTFRAPSAITGILVELIRNAVKHSDSDVEPVEVGLAVRRVGPDIVWRISNRCTKLDGRLDFGCPDRSTEPTSEHFGAQIIGDIVLRAFGIDDPEQIVHFPALTVEGWVHVEVACPAQE